MEKPPVLILEDDAPTREILAEVLSMEGYLVLGAATGQQALARLHDFGRPCLLLCDLALPDIDGLEVARRCHDDPQLRDTEVVFMTGTLRNVPPGKCLLRKPFGLDHLLATIREHSVALRRPN